ncbi:MAG: ribbon-helix-helix domain-containing protein [Pyrinomonadaceae bacterium]
MSVAKVTISIESGLLKKVDNLVTERVFSNRSQAIQSAVAEKVLKMDRNRLKRERAKLDKAEERSLADLGLSSDVGDGQWISDDILVSSINSLPSAKRDEVADFIEFLADRQSNDRKERQAAIAAYAAEFGGSDFDLDEDLERAGVDCLIALDEVAQ